MHNRLPDGTASRELTFREGVVVVPLVACIVALALYPGLITTQGEHAVDRSLAALCDYRYPGSDPESAVDADCPSGVEPQPTPDAVASRDGGGWTGYAPLAEVAAR
jgi:hypothetical protein